MVFARFRTHLALPCWRLVGRHDVN